MKELIKLCEKWMDDNIIIRKQIQIDNDNYTVFLETKTGLRIEYSVYSDHQTVNEKEFLTLINKLIKYNVERNLPF